MIGLPSLEANTNLQKLTIIGLKASQLHSLTHCLASVPSTAIEEIIVAFNVQDNTLTEISEWKKLDDTLSASSFKNLHSVKFFTKSRNSKKPRVEDDRDKVPAFDKLLPRLHRQGVLHWSRESGYGKYVTTNITGFDLTSILVTPVEKDLISTYLTFIMMTPQGPPSSDDGQSDE